MIITLKCCFEKRKFNENFSYHLLTVINRRSTPKLVCRKRGIRASTKIFRRAACEQAPRRLWLKCEPCALQRCVRILFLSVINRRSTPKLVCFFYGGEKGIRTLETVLGFTRFPVVRLRPTRPSLHGLLYYSREVIKSQEIFIMFFNKKCAFFIYFYILNNIY